MKKITSALIALSLFASTAHASVVITGTRVIYKAEEKEAIIPLTNKGETPVLVQSWIDGGNSSATPETTDAPFLINPPLTRLNGNKKQAVRAIYNQKKALPQDRESMFWYNMREIPATDPTAKKAQNTLGIIMRTRIKFFYRPVSMKEMKLGDAVKQLTWSQKGSQLVLNNPTPFHISISEIKLTEKGAALSLGDIPVSIPKANTVISKKVDNIKGKTLVITYLDDYGATRDLIINRQ